MVFAGRIASIAAVLVPLSTPTVAEETPLDKWNGYIEAEGKYSKQRSIGEGGLFIPLWQNDTDLVFTDLRGKFDDNDSQEFNLGLGYRTILNENWIIGGYGFYDRRRSSTGNHYDQATFGAEAFTEHLDLRANFYIPESTEKELDDGGPTGAFSGGQLQIQTLSNSKERALPGFDVELGYKFDITDNWNLTTTVGGFYFDADGYDEIAGPRARMELAYDNVPFLSEGSRFTIGFESQHDDVRGTQTFGLARLRIPFSQFIPGKSEKTAPLTALEKRMTTRIVRDVDIVSGDKKREILSSEIAEMTTAGGVTTSTATIINTGDDIATEVTNAGDNALIIVGGDITTNGVIRLRPGQTLAGLGQTLNLTGQSSGDIIQYTLPGKRPTITNTDNGAYTVRAEANTTINSLHLSGGLSGVFSNAANVTLENVSVSGANSVAINVNSGSTNFQGRNIRLSDGIRGIYVAKTAGNVDATFSNVTIDNMTHFSVEINDATASFSDMKITNIGTHGIYISNIFGSAPTVALNSTTIHGTGSYGILFSDRGGPKAIVSGNNNTITGTYLNGACNLTGVTGSISFTDIQGNGPTTCP